MSSAAPLDSRSPQLRRRKVRAVLAGGLVLGVGAVVTLANWNDSEFALADWDSGSFNLEGSIDGTTFDEHPTAAQAGALSFDIRATNLAPGDSVSAPFAIRLDGSSTYGAEVTMPPGTVTGPVNGLTYSMIMTEGFGCDSEALETVIPAGTALDATAADASFPLTAGAGDEPGTAVNVCFTVTADDSLQQGQSGIAAWEFLAESTS